MIEARKLCFVVNVFLDYDLAKFTISKLLSFYPESNLLVIFDGCRDSGLEKYCAEHNIIKVILDELNLKGCGWGGRWTRRYLDAYLNYSSADYLIKIDTDTGLNRPLARLPLEETDIFGNSRAASRERRYIQGGFIGLKRSAVEKIVHSNYLLDPVYTNARLYGYRRYSNQYAKSGELTNKTIVLSAQDVILSDVALSRLSLQFEEYDEVCCYDQGFISRNPELVLSKDAAFVHPIDNRALIYS